VFKTLDLYIIKKYFGTLTLMLLLLSGIITVFDVSQKIDDFIKNHASINSVIFEYYANFLPFMLNLLLPLFVFISVIFFTGRMAGQTEFVAIISSGVSVNRILRPYMICALIITLLSAYLYNEIIPGNQIKRWKFEYEYISPNRPNVSRNMHRQVQPGVFITIQSFLYTDSTGYMFSADKFEGKQLKTRLTANRISWNKSTKKWKLEGYTIRTIDKQGDNLKTGDFLDSTFNFNPRDFIQDEHWVEQLNYERLNDFIAKEKLRGAEDIEWYELEKYQRFSIPFSTFILTIIGFVVSYKKTRGGMGLKILIGITLSFSYIILMRFAGEFAKKNVIPTLLAVWIPNIIYSLIAFGMYVKAIAK